MRKHSYYIFIFLFLVFFSLSAEEKTKEETLKEETDRILARGQKIAEEFYSLDEGEDIKEITGIILQSAEIKEATKERILATGRRFFLFSYPSEGHQVKGFISFVPEGEENPLMIFLRGGNRLFGLMTPANELTTSRNYTVLATTYRGGVSEGTDEFGGDEVSDVQHMLEYLPTLQEKLKTQFSPKKTFILGLSRGGMEMFLALARSPLLQKTVTKAASLSGLLDLQESITNREDMKTMFIDDFGFVPGENEEEWIEKRNPITHVPSIRSDLPFLVLQGTNDIRVGLDEGYHMVEALEANGNPVTYLEFPGGDHCLSNQTGVMDIIGDWFEND